MRAWWAAQRAAGHVPRGAELDRVCGRDPRNGSGRKARARYLREEAAGRFWAPESAPAAAPAASAPEPAPGSDGGTTAGTASAVPVAKAASPAPVPAADAMAEREPARPVPAPAVLGDSSQPSHPLPAPPRNHSWS